MSAEEYTIGNSTVTIGSNNPFLKSDVEKTEPIKDLEESTVKVEEPKDIVSEGAVDVTKETLGEDVVEIKDTAEISEEVPQSNEETVDEEASEEEPSTKNSLKGIYHKVATQMREDGYILPEDEIPENATGEDVYSLYIKANKSKLQEEVAASTRTEVLTTLDKMGVNERDIQYAMAIRAGTDPNVLSGYVKYEEYSNLKADEIDSDKMLEVIKIGLKENKYSEERIKRITEGLEISGEDAIRAEFEDYQKEFKTKHDNFIQQQATIAAESAQREADEIKANTDYLESVFQQKEIEGEPISDTQLEDIRSAIFENNAVVEQNGKKYSTSEWNKFLNFDLQDFKTQLYLFKIMKYRGEELEGVRRKAEDKVEKDFMSVNLVEPEKLPSQNKSSTKKESKNIPWYELGNKV